MNEIGHGIGSTDVILWKRDIRENWIPALFFVIILLKAGYTSPIHHIFLSSEHQILYFNMLLI